MSYIWNRFKEPSTWASIGTVATMFFGVPTNTVSIVTQAIVGVIGAIGVLMPEKG